MNAEAPSIIVINVAVRKQSENLAKCYLLYTGVVLYYFHKGVKLQIAREKKNCPV